MRVMITRPREDAEPLAALLAEHGIDSLIEPLLAVTFVEGAEPDLDGVQGLLVTSANGIRAFAACSERRNLAVYAVGDASARAARDAGFMDVASAYGDVDALAALVRDRVDPAAGALLHAAGTHVAGNLGGRLADAGYDYRRAVLYETRPAVAFSDAAVEALEAGEIHGVLIYSPRTAAAFAGLVWDAGLDGTLAAMTAYCLSDAVAERIQALPWHAVRVAAVPEQAALVDEVLRNGTASLK